MAQQKQSQHWVYVMYSRIYFKIIFVTLLAFLLSHCLKIQYSPLDTSQPGPAGIIALVAPVLVELEENSSTDIPSFTLGGTVTGLIGTVILTNDGVDLSITANGGYSFDSAIISGSSYNVTVKTQPANRTCTISNGTGIIIGNVTNINVTCNCGNITRNWGTFMDQCNGTVSLSITAGTFGGQAYTSQTLTWMKCSHGQAWNSGANDCTGTGTAPQFGATQVQYCNANDESCNDATTKILNGTGTSGVYSACNDLNTANAGAGTFGIMNWRVPVKNELKLLVECTNTAILPNDGSNCGGSPSPSINNLFPNTINNRYRSSTTYTSDTANAWFVNFALGGISFNPKVFNSYVRCVSDP